MHPFSFPRRAASFAAAALFVWAQTAGFTQTLVGHDQAVIVGEAIYLPANAQQIAPANVGDVLPHPQGRYALVVQNDAALPPAAIMGEADTGAASLLLYDAKLRKTRTLWSRRADGGKHYILSQAWITGTNCAVVVTVDSVLAEAGKKSEETSSLLFFNLDKGLAPRVLATSATGFFVNASPTKPLFAVSEENSVRMGNAPRGTLGPVRTTPPHTFTYGWNSDGTGIYEMQTTILPATPTAEEQRMRNWYEWDGKTAEATPLKKQPDKTMFAQEPAPPASPIALQTGTAYVLAPTLVKPTPAPAAAITPFVALPNADKSEPAKLAKPVPAAGTLKPLFLVATAAPKSAAAEAKPFAFIAADAEDSFLLADQSAVLYQSGGALYAVPLVKINAAEYVKAQALQNAKQIGLGILMYSQDYDEVFPPQQDFAGVLTPYLRNADLFNGFTYLRPKGGNLASVAEPAQTVIGYLAAPGGRAVVYVDGHVVWEPQKP